MGKWRLLRDSNNINNCEINFASQKFLGLVEMTSGLVNASFSLPEWQAVKMIFFAPWHHTCRIISSCRLYNVPPCSSPQKCPFEKRTPNCDSNPTTTKTGHTPTGNICAFIRSMQRTQIIFLQGYILWYDYIFFCPFN